MPNWFILVGFEISALYIYVLINLKKTKDMYEFYQKKKKIFTFTKQCVYILMS